MEQVTAKEQFISHTSKNLDEDFDQNQLRVAWDDYLTGLESRPILKTALAQCPEIRQGKQLELIVHNSVQEEMVREIKPQLVAWLRTKLMNSNIELLVKVDDRKTDKIIYSDQERFQEMAKKNPLLIQLKQKFNLDFEG